MKLAHYEITAHLGSGGMGDVYQATDSKLGRSVAIKFLPETFSRDVDRVARFQREARVLASLNHPNIAAIYGVDEINRRHFLVMELITGETLDDRIKRGAIPLAEAIPIARQIADGLEAAHEQGIIHRDLKPANVKVREDGTVKVLDFGLAKTGTARAVANTQDSPTISMAATEAGMILGTAAYMSPEQTRGRNVDKRTDIWGFGAVLFEMLTGKRAFDGEDVSDILAAVIRAEPDWTALPPDVPPSIRGLLRGCLEKDWKQRIADISTARFVMLEAARSTPISAGAESPKQHTRTLIFALLIAAVLVSSIATWLITARVPTRASEPVRFSITPGDDLTVALTNGSVLALSRDGRQLVYSSGLPGREGLWLRSLDKLDSQRLRAITGSPISPFLSPDGKFVGFYVVGRGELAKIPVAGGSPTRLCAVTGVLRGAAWLPDGTVVFGSQDTSTGLLRVPADGGEPKTLTRPDTSKGELNHWFPSALPGGRALLFTIHSQGGNQNSQIAALDLTTGKYTTLIRGGMQAVYVNTGYIIYAQGAGPERTAPLRAVPFDPVQLTVLGDSVPVIDGVGIAPLSGSAAFSVSENGTLAYVPGNGTGSFAPQRSLVWVGRDGRELETIKTPLRAYTYPRLSPDETQLALDVRDQENDIWIWNFARETLRRFTVDPANDFQPLWTPHGDRILFHSTRGGAGNVFVQNADRSGGVERLTTSSNTQYPQSITPDGKHVVLLEQSSAGNDLTVLHMDAKPWTEPLLQTPASEANSDISPDGRWIVYSSDETGRTEVWVRPFPNVNGGGRWQISTEGGNKAMWAKSGRELFYAANSGEIMSVPVQLTPTFDYGKAVKLFDWPTINVPGLARTYDVSRDGKKFLMIEEAPAAGNEKSPSASQVVVVVNWSEELKRLAPVK